MRKLISKIILLLLVASLCVSFRADKFSDIDAKSRKVINAYLDKIGGQEALSKIKSIHFEGKFMTRDGMEGSVSSYARKSGDIIYTMTSKDFSIISVGKNGVYKNYLNGKEVELSKTDQDILKRDAYMFPLAFLDSMAVSTKYGGKAKYNNELDCYLVTITYPFGTELCYFNAKTKMLHAVYRGDFHVLYSDFRNVGSITYPYKVKQMHKDGDYIIFALSKFEFDKDFPDTVFDVK